MSQKWPIFPTVRSRHPEMAKYCHTASVATLIFTVFCCSHKIVKVAITITTTCMHLVAVDVETIVEC